MLRKNLTLHACFITNKKDALWSTAETFGQLLFNALY